MHFKLLYPNDYLGAHDLAGKDVTLTIRHLVVEDLKTERGTERKPVMYFVETQKAAEKSASPEKRLVLNKTNASTIAGMYGTETNDWKGKRITLCASIVDAFGQKKEAIRVRPVPPAARPSPESPSPATETKEQ